MGRLKRKLFFSTLMYIAGFASAVYVTAPENSFAMSDPTVGEQSGWRTRLKTKADSLCSQQLIDSLDAKLDNVLVLAEQKAMVAGDVIRAKFIEKQDVYADDSAAEN